MIRVKNVMTKIMAMSSMAATSSAIERDAAMGFSRRAKRVMMETEIRVMPVMIDVVLGLAGTVWCEKVARRATMVMKSVMMVMTVIMMRVYPIVGSLGAVIRLCTRALRNVMMGTIKIKMRVVTPV